MWPAPTIVQIVGADFNSWIHSLHSLTNNTFIDSWAQSLQSVWIHSLRSLKKTARLLTCGLSHCSLSSAAPRNLSIVKDKVDQCVQRMCYWLSGRLVVQEHQGSRMGTGSASGSRKSMPPRSFHNLVSGGGHARTFSC